jgi:hypothetical protein
MANGWPEPITVLRICPQKNHFSPRRFSWIPAAASRKKRIFAEKKKQWLQALIMANPLTIG